jgi:hypothetical protein
MVRFRIYADAGVTGWGWIIDNLEIQVGAQSAVGDPAVALQPALHQNVPNPMRSRTAIRYVLPKPGAATLAVFDVNGRLVRELASGVQAAGEHAIEWDGRDVNGVETASGVYFYNLVTPGETLKRKLVVVR